MMGEEWNPGSELTSKRVDPGGRGGGSGVHRRLTYDRGNSESDSGRRYIPGRAGNGDGRRGVRHCGGVGGRIPGGSRGQPAGDQEMVNLTPGVQKGRSWIDERVIRAAKAGVGTELRWVKAHDGIVGMK